MARLTTAEVADPYRGLAAGMIQQAARDAHAGDVLARVWLLIAGYDLAADLLGMQVGPDRWRRWVVAGCPGNLSHAGRPRRMANRGN